MDPGDKLILMSDMNEWMEDNRGRSDGQVWGHENYNSERIHETHASAGVDIANIYVQHKDAHEYVW